MIADFRPLRFCVLCTGIEVGRTAYICPLLTFVRSSPLFGILFCSRYVPRQVEVLQAICRSSSVP